MTTPIAGTSLVKCSERSIRRPCRYCGRTDGLYWAHDMDEPGNKFCQRCRGPRNFVMIEADGSRHSCRDGAADQSPDDDMPVPVITDAKPARAFGGVSANGNAAQAASGIAQALAAALETLRPPIDAAEVGGIVDGKLGAFRDEITDVVGGIISERVSKLTLPTTVRVERGDGKAPKEIKGCHAILPEVLLDLSARQHVLMVGPAGTGKSTIAEHAADALSLPFYSISLSPQTPASQLLGYMNAVGDYVRSLFREAFEHGGVFHFDEFDNGNPSILALINAALANGQMAFPDGMVKRHADFLAVASANTYGRGADRMYVGRQAIDAATLDRFTVEDVEYDAALEEALCIATGLDPAKVTKVLAYVRALRKNAETQKMAVIFGQRSSVGSCALLAQGKSVTKTVNARIRKGLSDQDWAKANSGVSSLPISL